MHGLPKSMPRNELLEWLNQQTRSQGVSTDRIEQLGNGVGFLTLLSQLHPGVLGPTHRYIRKPKSEYDNITNLKALATALQRLGVSKNIDIPKLSKMKLQDNFQLLQWFYAYAQSLISKEQENKTQLGNYRATRVNFKAPTILKKTALQKFDSEDSAADTSELKTISANARRIWEIEAIIHSTEEGDSAKKLSKIKGLLGLGSPNKEQRRTASFRQNSHGDTQQTSHQSAQNQKCLQDQEEYKSATRDPVFSFKSQTLEERCQSYLKSSSEHQANEGSFRKREVRLSENNLIYEYEPEQEHEQGRLTDTSLLLNSERKSMREEGNLLDKSMQSNGNLLLE